MYKHLEEQNRGLAKKKEKRWAALLALVMVAGGYAYESMFGNAASPWPMYIGGAAITAFGLLLAYVASQALAEKRDADSKQGKGKK